MRTEEWRPVEGFEGYLVSDFGRVKSLDRQCRHVARGTRRETVSVRPREDPEVLQGRAGVRPREARGGPGSARCGKSTSSSRRPSWAMTGASTTGGTQAPWWSTT